MRALSFLLGMAVGLALTSCAKASTLDRTLYYSAQAATVMDWVQTKEITRNPNFKEGNPLLGEKPSDGKIAAVMLTRMAATHFVYTKVEGDYRTAVLGALNVVWWGVVAHNHRLGVRPFDDDPWTGQDKTKHLAVGLAMGALSQAFTDRRTGFAVCSTIGIAKELIDKKASYKDAAITALGCAGGVGIGNLIITPTSINYSTSF